MVDSVSARVSKQSRQSEWPSSNSEADRPRGQLRLRRAMYLVFGALALASLLQGMLWLHMDAARATETRLVLQSERHPVWVQELWGQAALLAVDSDARAQHGAELAALLARGHRETASLQALQGALGAKKDAAVPGADDTALASWLSASQALTAQAQQLLQQVQTKPARAGGDDAWVADLRKQAAAVQAETVPALRAAQRLSQVWQAQAQRQSQLRHRQLLWSTAVQLALLVLLAILVVEPRARALNQQLRRLGSQSTDVKRLALVAEHTTALVMITDAKDRIQWVNAAFTRVCGWPLEEAKGQRPRQLLSHPYEDKAVYARVKNAVVKGEGLRHEWLRKARDGRDLWLDIDLRPVADDSGEVVGFVRVATDVTLRVQQQSKLQALWSALPAGVVVQSETGEIVDANRAAERILGLSQGEMRGLSSLDARWRTVHEDLSECPPEQHPAMRTLRTGQSLANQNVGVHTPDGSLRWLLVNTEPQRDTQGGVCGVITCFIDISESRLLQQQLHTHARTDQLTQLPNRMVVMERLQRAILHAQRHPGYGFALLFMDFDRFKQINDTLGHSAGDELLRQIAQRLQEAMRPGDAVARVQTQTHVAARIGGDEFVVVLDGVDDRANATVIADRLLRELSEPYVIGNSPVQSGVSIGVVLHGADEPTQRAPLDATAAIELTDQPGVEPGSEARSIETQAEELLRNADTAMYEAKRAGRGRWVMFDDSMHERVVRALAVENDLRRAIKEDELYVVYQPVVDLGTRMLVGVEALVRWRHPERGLVSPVEFITVAEECGLIDAVGEIVLRKACLQYVKWQRSLGSAAPRQLAVNLSRAQLKRAALVQDVHAILQETAMPVDRLQLEVTESLAAQDERVVHTLRELKSLGVKLALDDFGTGYSSLACLHLMPVDTVKVDRSFVRHAETVEYHRVLIEATIRVARTLGMTTVAEGIETEGQAELMKRLECDRGQGFLFSRPLEVADLEAWVRDGKGMPPQVMLAAH